MSKRQRQPLSKEIRDHVFERDDYRCQNCGLKSEAENIGEVPLELHHITSMKDGSDNSPDNLITLCANCHRKLEVEDIETNLLQTIDRTFEATDHAKKIESFGSDSIEIVKINILVASLAIPAISLMSQFSETGVSEFNNIFTQASGVLWFLSIIAAESTYVLCRTSGASLSAIQEIIEGEQPEESESVIQGNKRVYRRNVALIAGSILLTTAAICLFVIGAADGVGLL